VALVPETGPAGSLVLRGERTLAFAAFPGAAGRGCWCV
jgi:hypothetical protein